MGFVVHASIATACCIARSVAARMPKRSMYEALLRPMPAVQCFCTHRNACSRSSGSSALLSRMKEGMRVPLGRMHAAATTGPARGPLPASSMPAVRPVVFRVFDNSKNSYIILIIPRSFTYYCRGSDCLQIFCGRAAGLETQLSFKEE